MKVKVKRGIGPQPPATPVGSLTPVAWWKLDEAAASMDASDSSAAYRGVVLSHRNAAQQLPEAGRAGRAPGQRFATLTTTCQGPRPSELMLMSQM